MSRLSEVICEVAQNGLAVLVVATTVGRTQNIWRDYHQKPGAKWSCCKAVSTLTIRGNNSCPVVGGKREGDEGIILVATQVVEVSLNIGFDVLYCDLVPLEDYCGGSGA